MLMMTKWLKKGTMADVDDNEEEGVNMVDVDEDFFLCIFSQILNIPERIILISTTGLR